MKTVGIIAEYNPFHNGHAAHIAKTRAEFGDNAAIVCVMSGNFVQRGEPAVLEKHVRAEAALHGGADLVLELPCPWSLSSAEHFASGAVSVLNALGCVDYLSFGCECGSAEKLEEAAQLLLSPDFGEAVREELKHGVSFAAARQSVLEKLSGKSFDMLSKPNNILAVEYIKSLILSHSSIIPLAVRREGAGHDEAGVVSGGCSASAVRRMMLSDKDFSPFVPASAYALYCRELSAGRGPVSSAGLEQAVLYRLRTMTDRDFARLPDMSEGLDRRFVRASQRCGSIEEIYEAVKTKRYALSRIRRAAMCALIGIYAGNFPAVPYLRVLAANETGRGILRRAKAGCTLITKPAAAKRLAGESGALFRLESQATDIYALGFSSARERRGGQEWTTSPFIL